MSNFVERFFWGHKEIFRLSGQTKKKFSTTSIPLNVVEFFYLIMGRSLHNILVLDVIDMRSASNQGNSKLFPTVGVDNLSTLNVATLIAVR